MKLVFLDIDGTLTPPAGHTIPSSALRALELARQNGHRLFLCSGRNREMYVPVANQFPFDGAIGCAGGWIEIGGEPIFDHPLDSSVAEYAIQTLHEHDFYAVRECLDGSFMDEQLTRLLADPSAIKGKEKWLQWQQTMGGSLWLAACEALRGRSRLQIGFYRVCSRTNGAYYRAFEPAFPRLCT